MVTIPTITVDAGGVKIGTAKKLANHETGYKAVYTYTGAQLVLDAQEIHVFETVEIGTTVKHNTLIYDYEGNVKGATGDSYHKIPY